MEAGADVNAVDNEVCMMLCLYVYIKCGIGTNCTSLRVEVWICQSREIVNGSGC